MLGGGMRQAGVLAAAGLYALEHHVARLADDHANAARLAEALRSIPRLKVSSSDTNILYVDVPADDVSGLSQHVRETGILALIGTRTRLVTHMDVTASEIDHVAGVFAGFYARSRAAA
jgi:threonine aldolase